MARDTNVFFDDFRGNLAIPLTASNVGTRWSKADTSSAGAPTVIGVNGGGLKLLHDNTNEVQNLCVYFGDILSFTIADLISAEFVVSCTAAFNAATTLAFGMCSARNDAIASITAFAAFRVAASTNVVTVESDDGTNDNDAISTGGLTLGTTPKKFKILFADANYTREPPSLSLGSTSNVQFEMGNAQGSARRVGAGTRFDMTNYTSGLQPFIQLQKTAATSTDYAILHSVKIEYKLPQYQ